MSKLDNRQILIMKIQLLSDLHLSVHPLDVPQTNADVVVLAGDIWRPKEAVSWAQRIGKPTLYVAGNHEFYGGDLITTMQQLRLHAATTPVKVLEKEVWYHKDVRFLGAPCGRVTRSSSHMSNVRTVCAKRES